MPSQRPQKTFSRRRAKSRLLRRYRDLALWASQLSVCSAACHVNTRGAQRRSSASCRSRKRCRSRRVRLSLLPQSCGGSCRPRPSNNCVRTKANGRHTKGMVWYGTGQQCEHNASIDGYNNANVGTQPPEVDEHVNGWWGDQSGSRTMGWGIKCENLNRRSKGRGGGGG